MAGAEYVEGDDVRRNPFRAAIAPLPSLVSAVRDAAGAGRASTPEPWCNAIRAHLRDEDYETLAPLVTPRSMLVPDALIGLSKSPGESLKDGIERMMATPVEDLAEEIGGYSASHGNGVWDATSRDPARWLRRYVTSLLRAWKGFEPVWDLARTALDREVERIGVATALDAQLELLDGLLASGTVADGRWCMKCSFYDGRARFPDSGLILTPLVAGVRASIVGWCDEVIGSVAYPVRSALALPATEPPAAALEGLLGIPRSRLLRAVTKPTSIGKLAAVLRAVPSAATHHVAALEAAGLVERDRLGRHVLVRRTARGEALLELYDNGNGSTPT